MDLDILFCRRILQILDPNFWLLAAHVCLQANAEPSQAAERPLGQKKGPTRPEDSLLSANTELVRPIEGHLRPAQGSLRSTQGLLKPKTTF